MCEHHDQIIGMVMKDSLDTKVVSEVDVGDNYLVSNFTSPHSSKEEVV